MIIFKQQDQHETIAVTLEAGGFSFIQRDSMGKDQIFSEPTDAIELLEFFQGNEEWAQVFSDAGEIRLDRDEHGVSISQYDQADDEDNCVILSTAQAQAAAKAMAKAMGC